MKNKFSLLILCAFVSVAVLSAGFTALALDEQPSLKSVSFENAEIQGGFSPDAFQYDVMLNDSSVSPVLKDYEISGDADLYVTYNYDEANRQTGIIATLQFEAGSLIYSFNYLNPVVAQPNSENRLADIYCPYTQLSPTLNDEDTSYKLYIPSDMTELKITPVAKDTGAYCPALTLTLDKTQEPEITLTCTASDLSTRNYVISIKRVDKTLEQVKAEMSKPGYTTFVEKTRVYEKPEFLLILGASAAGVLLIVLLFRITKRIAVSPYDSSEKPFYKEK